MQGGNSRAQGMSLLVTPGSRCQRLCTGLPALDPGLNLSLMGQVPISMLEFVESACREEDPAGSESPASGSVELGMAAIF